MPNAGGEGPGYVLRKGGARFVVAHDEGRVFRVRVGTLVVEDVGTTFTVARTSPDRVDLAVEQGPVRVVRGGIASELAAGERGTFACGASEAGVPDRDVELPVRATSARSCRACVARYLAESGRYGDAFESLRAAGTAAVRDVTDDLLLAADAARLSGHPADAVPYLERVLRAHGSDPRAGLAAFTLGRVQLDVSSAGRTQPPKPSSAPRSGGGPLAEDALAREVEAWSRAGDAARARALALDYQRMYPAGRRAKAVARFGGIE